MDRVRDVTLSHNFPSSVGSALQEVDSDAPHPANSPVEEYVGKEQTDSLEVWLSAVGSPSKRSRRKMRENNPLAIPQHPLRASAQHE